MAYAVHDYDAMLADGVRSRSYLEAIAAGVTHGDVVVEIGTGVGYFAVAACRAGARHVYAIETNAAMAIAPDVLAANGCTDRVTLIHGDSRRVALPELGDVLLEDMRGILPFHGERMPSLVDARTRLMRPDATLISVRDTIRAAPAVADATFADAHITPGDAPFGIDRRTVAARVRQNWYRARLAAGNMLAEPATIATLDYRTLQQADAEGDAHWMIGRDGVLDGIAIWFDAELAGGVCFSNAPSAPPAIYAQAFLPLERSIPVTAGDSIAMQFRAKLIDGEYLFAWNTERTGVDGVRHVFRQSNLGALSMRLEDLHRRSADFVPSANDAQARLERLLTLVDGRRSLDVIASEMRAAFPARFETHAAARTFVSATLGSLADEDADRRVPRHS